MSWVSRLRVDVGPWRRHRDYRRLLVSQGVTQFGSAVTMVAAPLQVKQLTGSFLLVGLLGAIEFVPFVVGGLWGGALADSRDRRRVVLVCEVALLLLSALLLGNALLPTPQVWAVFVTAGGIALAGALQRPASDALLPRVVSTDDLPAAISLQSVVQTSTFLVGPSIGGLLAAWHLPTAYALDVATFVVSAVALASLAPVPPTDTSVGAGLREIALGIRYAVSRRDLLGSYAVDIAAMLFAIPDAVFPFLADDLHAPWALGLLYSAAGAGSLVAAATSGWTSHVHRHGLAIVLAASVWGVAMFVAGVVPGGLWPVLVFLAVAGGADMVSGVFRSTLWNQTIPDELRGRLAGIELLSYTTGPTLGNARAGAMAAFGGARFAIWSGGLLCVAAVAALTAALPTFRRYDARTDPHALAERARRAARGGRPGDQFGSTAAESSP